MGRKPILSLGEIEALKNRGLTQKQIAEIVGVTPQAISKFVRQHGGQQTPRQTVAQHFPWRVPKTMHTSPYQRMRDHGEWMATGGKGMKEYKLQRLRWWYRFMREQDVVLEFDPNIPPIEGVSNRGGFAYRPRLDSDGDLLIRVNDYTEMTAAGRTIWAMPDPEEEP